MIVWVFPVLAACGVLVAYFLKVRLSGNDLNGVKLYFCLAFNGLFVVPYMGVLGDDDFLFLGRRPEIISEHPFIGWVAFICIFFSCFCTPC